VSILSQDSIDRFAADIKLELFPGDLCENIDLSGTDLSDVAILDRFRIGEVELEVTQIGKDAHDDVPIIYGEAAQRASIMLTEGIFCRVLHGGLLHPGDTGEYFPRPLQFRIITLSDRAHAGEYEDRSGPHLRELLEAFLAGTRWHPQIDALLLPDDADKLRAELVSAQEAGVDVVFTTGGTGVGPRDIAPETVAAVCNKLIPGIMEGIRIKYGGQNPRALLSRSVAGVCGEMLIYALPGSVRAVEEYMGEVLLTLEHLLLMLHGLDVH
jgi:molybdopterin adenylyltransferase